MSLPAIPEPAQQHIHLPARRKWPWARILRRAPIVLLLAGGLYYGGWGALSHRIDDDLAFTPEEPGGSHAAAMTAALIDREVNRHRWTPNDPAIAPTAFLDNTPNYQIGLQRAAGRFTFELLDQIARTRGSSRTDPDVERAAGYLQFPPDIWVFNPEKSLLPAIPSEDQYRAAHRSLTRYTERLARGEAIFERRADALATTLTRISDDLGSQTARLDAIRLQGGTWIFSGRADDIFYQNKGTLYAYRMILGALGTDFEAMIRERGLTALWAQALDSLERASQLHPIVVLNAPSDTSIFANHLMLQGFYMKRAILQLEEVVSALAV